MPTNSTLILYKGRLTCEPQGHMNGKMVRFGVAIDDDYVKRGPDGKDLLGPDGRPVWIRQTMFLETQAWNKLAEEIEAMGLQQGDEISVTGQVKQSPEKSDPNRVWTKVWAKEVKILSRVADRRAARAEKTSEEVPF